MYSLLHGTTIGNIKNIIEGHSLNRISSYDMQIRNPHEIGIDLEEREEQREVKDKYFEKLQDVEKQVYDHIKNNEELNKLIEEFEAIIRNYEKDHNAVIKDKLDRYRTARSRLAKAEELAGQRGMWVWIKDFLSEFPDEDALSDWIDTNGMPYVFYRSDYIYPISSSRRLSYHDDIESKVYYFSKENLISIFKGSEPTLFKKGDVYQGLAENLRIVKQDDII